MIKQSVNASNREESTVASCFCVQLYLQALPNQMFCIEYIINILQGLLYINFYSNHVA